MFTFTKTTTSNIAYIIEWNSLDSSYTTKTIVEQFETLEEAEKFWRKNELLFNHATLYKKEILNTFSKRKTPL